LKKHNPLLPLLPFLFLLSCASAPKTSDQPPFESGVMPLDKGAAAYVLIDVANARPIMNGIKYFSMTDKNMIQMLDRTQNAAIGVFFPSPNETRYFQLVSWGNYPASGSSIAFGANKDWKKLRPSPTKPPYWYSEKSQMSIVVTPKQAFVLSSTTKTPRTPIPASEGIKIPEGFTAFGKDAALSCWLSDPAPILKQRLNAMGVPLELPAEQLFLSLFPLEGQPASASHLAADEEQMYEARLRIKFQFIGQARILTNLLFLARRNYVPPAKTGDPAQDSAAMMSSLLFANPAVQTEHVIMIKSPPLSLRDISLLFSMFSL
jgi:hypothetical protein